MYKNIVIDDVDIDKEFSENLGKIMDAKGITAKVLSLSTGIHVSSIYMYREGHIMPTLFNIYKLVKALGVSISDLCPSLTK